MSKEHPILFNGAMVRALLDGSKTQTRRVVKPAKCKTMGVPMACCEIAGEINRGDYSNCPNGQPGYRLWVREAWRACRDLDATPPRDIAPGSSIEYEATKRSYAEIGLTGKLRPGMFMPRWASRINLEITAVRVERLQDISEADAMAEGASECDPVSGREVLLAGPSQRGSFVLHYRSIWESINGPKSWDTNPWVWCVSFRRIHAS